MNFCCGSRSTLPMLIAAAMPFALAACAGVSDTKPDTGPDKPLKSTNVCAASDIPKGWIRTNDWRAKNCGAEDAGATKVATTAKASVNAKATAPSGANNWMTITEIAHARIGRSLTICAGEVPEGWTLTARYWDKGRCGNPAKPGIKNVMLIERVK